MSQAPVATALPAPTRCRVVLGDARDMSFLDDQSVHLVVTSPPYWQLKDYGHDDQLGHGQSFEAYINDLNLVWQECARVLVPGGRLAINIGDQFVSTAEYGRFKVMPIHAEIIKFCETVGLDYMGSIIWRKITNTAASGGGALMGSYPYPRSGVVKQNFEYILLFRRPGSTPPPSKESKAAAVLGLDEWKTYFTSDWAFPGERQVGHGAMFPIELPTRLIRMFSFPGDTVLDPFLGSGTTAAAAIGLDRNVVGIELNEAFLPLISEKTGASAMGERFVVDRSAPPESAALTGRMESWPYGFVDHTTGITKRRRTLTDAQRAFKDAPRFRIVGPIDSVTIGSSQGCSIRLTGVLPVEGREAEAMAYLSTLIGERAVLLDGEELPDGTKSGIVLLENRTFVAGRLLRTQGVTIDPEAGPRLQGRLQRHAAAKAA